MKYAVVAVIALVALAAVALFLLAPARKPVAATSERREAYAGLRSAALGATPTTLGIHPTSAPYGVVMEIDVDGETATIVGFSSGEASLYLSTGGGVIGGGSHANVRGAAQALVAEAGRHLSKMTRTTSFPRPAAGHASFFVLTANGVYTATAVEDDLGEERSSFSPLFYAGQDLLTELHRASPD